MMREPSALDAVGIERGRRFTRVAWALGVGGFAIGTGEFATMGVLPEMARDLGVTIPQAGRIISAYALGVVVGAPVLAVLAAQRERRSLLLSLMLLVVLANAATAMAGGYLPAMLLRCLAGLPHAAYFGVAALVAASLAPPHKRAQAVGLVMSGLALSAMLGMPLATWLGQRFGWRMAFALVAASAALACVLIRRHVPVLPAAKGSRPWRELGALVRPQVWLTLGTAAVGFAGMFAVFSYVKPLLAEASGVPQGAVPAVLALVGAGMVTGNMAGARLADRHLAKTIAGLLVWSVFVLLAFPLTVSHAAALCANIFLLGTLVAIGPALQVRLMDVAGEAQTLAAALNHSAFNLANALGAWLGGAVIAAGYGVAATGWIGALLSLAGLAVFAASARR